jgi:arylamine N-acetyltransferase
VHRLGLEVEPPSVDALFRLHRAHAERVSYETLWIHLGERWDIDPAESAVRIAKGGRGGYCFHLNGALSELLLTVGYDVRRHVGGVHGPAGATQAELTNHLVLTVHGLPTDDNPNGVWYVDVGLGDALHEPLPLVAGTYEQGPFRLALAETPNGVGDWHLAHDPLGSFTGMAWRSAPCGMDAFAERHGWLSAAPESSFVRVLTAERRDASGADILHSLTLKRIGDNASDVTLTTDADLFDVLGDLFGLDVSTVELAQRRELFDRLRVAHDEWEAAGRP